MATRHFSGKFRKADGTILDGTDLTFDQWRKLVNRRVMARAMLSCDDLPDVDYYSMWDCSTPPQEAAEEVLRNACEDMCMSYDSIFGGE